MFQVYLHCFTHCPELGLYWNRSKEVVSFNSAHEAKAWASFYQGKVISFMDEGHLIEVDHAIKGIFWDEVKLNSDLYQDPTITQDQADALPVGDWITVG